MASTNPAYTKISSLPASSQGKRRVMEFHLDDNHDVLNLLVELVNLALWEQGGVVKQGTVSLTGTTFSVDALHIAVSMDGVSTLTANGETYDVASVGDGYHRLVINANPKTTDKTYVDPETGETITDTMATGFGTIGVVLGDTTAYPTLSGAVAPLVKFQMSAGSVATWSMDTDYIAKLRQGPLYRSGTTANRPTPTEVGYMYFDTDLGKPIWWNGTGWVDATGTAV